MKKSSYELGHDHGFVARRRAKTGDADFDLSEYDRGYADGDASRRKLFEKHEGKQS